jgi:site-specific DNA-methyltransferase (adenine-specific)
VNLTTETVPLDALTPHPRNVRQGDVGAISESLKAHGQYRPIVAQRSTGHILAGNHTFKAAQALGWSEIAVTFLDVSDDQAVRIMLADNRTNDLATYDDAALVEMLRELGETDDGLAGTLFDGDALDEMIDKIAEPIVQDDPPNDAPAITSVGNVWLLGEHRLVCGDSSQLLPLVASDSVRLVLTDPPYFGVLQDDWDRQWSNDDEFHEWLRSMAVQMARIIVPSGSLYLFTSPQQVADIEVSVLRPALFLTLNRIVWRKNTGHFHRVSEEMLTRFHSGDNERILFAEPLKVDAVQSSAHRTYENQMHALRARVFAPIREYLAAERNRSGMTNSQIDEAAGWNGMSAHFFDPSQWQMPNPEHYKRLRSILNRNGNDYLRQDYDYLRQDYDYLRQDYDDLRQEYEHLRRPFDVPTAGIDRPTTEVWSFDTPLTDRSGHPAEKPIALTSHMILTSTRDNEIVLDPFAGSGSTLIAAHKTGRICYAIELDPHYCDLICARYQKETGDLPRLEATGEAHDFLTP